MPSEWKAGVRPNSGLIRLAFSRFFSAGYSDSTHVTRPPSSAFRFTKSDEPLASLYSFGDFNRAGLPDDPSEIGINAQVSAAVFGIVRALKLRSTWGVPAPERDSETQAHPLA